MVAVSYNNLWKLLIDKGQVLMAPEVLMFDLLKKEPFYIVKHQI